MRTLLCTYVTANSLWLKVEGKNYTEMQRSDDSRSTAAAKIVLRKARGRQHRRDSCKKGKQRSDDSRSTAAAKLPPGRQHRRDSCRKGKSALWSLRTIAHLFPWWPFLLVLGHERIFFKYFEPMLGWLTALDHFFPVPSFLFAFFVALLFCAAPTFDSMSCLCGHNDTYTYIIYCQLFQKFVDVSL